jgi:cation:H+ antiporter
VIYNEYFTIVLGFICAGIGGELFVRGVVEAADWLRIPSRIAAVTLAAFATSSPELTTSVNAALAGAPQIGFGDALGSNIVNISVVLALAVLVKPIRINRNDIIRDYPFALGFPVIVYLLSLDGIVSRIDGAVLLVLFGIWMYLVIRIARRERERSSGLKVNRLRIISFIILGVSFLIASGKFIVVGASAIAHDAGIDPFVIGATVIALGTSMPEIATSIVSSLRGHEEIGIGNIIGSNIFNGFFIVAIAALICPIDVETIRSETTLNIITGLVTLAVIYPVKKGILGRTHGLILLGVYASYVLLIMR